MSDKLKRHPAVTAKILPDGYVALQLKKTDWIHVLTPLGGAVWEFSDGKSTIDDIFDEISKLKGVEADPSLKKQIADLIEELKKVTLLVPDDYESPEDEQSTTGGGCGSSWHPKEETSQAVQGI